MTDPRLPPPNIGQSGNDNSRLGLVERGLEIVRALTLQNVLTLGLLIMMAIPAYAAWKFLTDRDFRAEFMSTYRVIDLDVPCLVAATSEAGQSERYGVAVGYESVGRIEHLILYRANGIIRDTDLPKVCEEVNAAAKMVRNLYRDREKQ